ncbi:MAG: response regulator [Oceanospirillaceae bacterium]|nr:response regulator [Oceanospirillaceae bacterium]MCP5335607.1 response regulator [Oceanospirillaceae bacterium]
MHILIIEDETELAAIMRDYLVREGYQVSLENNGLFAVQSILQNNYDLVLLDLMLPGKDGITICREVRAENNVPIIMVTAKVEEIDRLLGLEMGADDYICKPFSPREVVARVKTVLRRLAPQQENPRLHMDKDRLTVLFAGKECELTLVEWRILATLNSKVSRIFSRDQLINHAYDDQRVVNDRTIDSHINKLRKKLVGLIGEDPIKSVYGVGYKLELPG